ncbi:hypothetical protein Mal15_32060 [Stieleria maiorica]|uniref:Uncharacterized protein n=1 Tax=Stieleria maiorica TaxID=2795974 RepID=A0A5B9MGB9_9BACT|nr:hypothetical protein Mal15_32060 [Stieleria maiorica]
MVLACGMIGVPIAAPPPKKNGRFPCENCPCGCVTADYCWDKCCCHSDREKLQWARENGVRPPEFLVARVLAMSPGLAVAEVSTRPAKAKSCCCCSQATGQCATDPIDSTNTAGSEKASDALRVVRLEDAARCHGIDLVWSLLSGVFVELQPGEVISITAPLLYYLALDNDRAYAVVRHPDPPVP